jgi:type II secretory pathway pseudopilin PulG
MDRQRKDERGYAMAALLVGIAIMMVFLGMAMPVWNQQAKREKEEELLFRLKQYAHAIALYQRRLPGAQPPSVDVLVEQRFLRRKYKDPMTGADFALLRVGQVTAGMTTPMPGMTVPMPGSTGGGGRPPTGFGQTSRSSGPSGSGPFGAGSGSGPGGQSIGGGPIRGVVSTSAETSLREWKGRTRYDQWEVTPEDIVPRFLPVQGPDMNQPGQQRPGQGRSPGPGGGRGQVPSGVPSGVRPGG